MSSRPGPQTLKIALIAAVAGFVGFVSLDSFLPIPAVLPQLKGAVTPPPAPVWSWSTLRSGGLAGSIGTWFEANVGLRSFWVRLDNQINYSLFGELTKRGDGSRLINGPHDWFFEAQYLDYAITRGAMSEQDQRKMITRLRRVQDKLAKRGIPLLLVIAPSKVEVYPEHIPAKLFAGRSPEQTKTNYENARELLRESGINLVDGPALYRRWKQEGARDLFARSGTHWSYQSAIRVWDEIRGQLNPRMRRQIPDFQIPETARARPTGNDRDLLDLANLLIPQPYEHDLPKPAPLAQHDVTVEKLPRLLWVHDSFGWVLIELLYQANAAQPSESLYYFATCMRIPGGTPTATDLKKINWPDYLKSYDAVVLVWTEIAYEFDSCGFIEALDNALD